MFCQRCGNEIKEGNKFCPKCGCQIQYMDANSIVLNDRNQKKTKKFGVILTVVLLMIAFVFGGFAIYRDWYNKNEVQKEIDVPENQDREEFVTANNGDIENNEDIEANLEESKSKNSDNLAENEEITVSNDVYVLQSSEHYYANGTLLYKSEYTYDDMGKEIKEICYDEDDIVAQWYECEYENNKDGNEIKKRYCYIDSEMKGWEEYEYNLYGKLIKLRSCDEDGSVNEWIEFTYDERGKLVEGVETHSWGISNRYKCEYDSLGRCSKCMLYSENGGGMTHWIEFEYDENGNRIKETVYKADGSLDEWQENEYILLGMDNQYISKEENPEDMEVDVESVVKQIRQWYSETQTNIGSLPCKTINDSITGYYDSDGNLVKAVVVKGYNDIEASREYYYHDQKLYFAFIYSGTREKRLYFNDDQLIRYIDEDGKIYDNDEAKQLTDLLNQATNEAEGLMNILKR